MIQMQTRLKVADNSGAKEVMFIRAVGGAVGKIAHLGDVFMASVKVAEPNAKIKKGDVVRAVIVRTFVGERSFRIQEVHPAAGYDPADEFEADGEPRNPNYYNIYSRAYVTHLLQGNPAVRRFRFLPDRDFDRRALMADAQRRGAAANSTRVLGGWQVNGCILQPWHFVVIEKR